MNARGAGHTGGTPVWGGGVRLVGQAIGGPHQISGDDSHFGAGVQEERTCRHTNRVFLVADIPPFSTLHALLNPRPSHLTYPQTNAPKNSGSAGHPSATEIATLTGASLSKLRGNHTTVSPDHEAISGMDRWGSPDQPAFFHHLTMPKNQHKSSPVYPIPIELSSNLWDALRPFGEVVSHFWAHGPLEGGTAQKFMDTTQA